MVENKGVAPGGGVEEPDIGSDRIGSDRSLTRGHARRRSGIELESLFIPVIRHPLRQNRVVEVGAGPSRSSHLIVVVAILSARAMFRTSSATKASPPPKNFGAQSRTEETRSLHVHRNGFLALESFRIQSQTRSDRRLERTKVVDWSPTFSKCIPHVRADNCRRERCKTSGPSSAALAISTISNPRSSSFATCSASYVKVGDSIPSSGISCIRAVNETVQCAARTNRGGTSRARYSPVESNLRYTSTVGWAIFEGNGPVVDILPLNPRVASFPGVLSARRRWRFYTPCFILLRRRMPQRPLALE